VDDAQLVAGVIAGRQECFETLVERHQRPVHALVYRWLGDHAVADEVVQATFVQAYTHLVDFRGDAPFRSWLYGIALNQVSQVAKKPTRERTVPIDDVPEGDLPQVEGTTVSGRLRDRLADLITRLPPRQRAVVTLRIVGDLAFKEIAKLEGISENSAKVSYHHAVTRLRKWMGRG
jgi:RNA polymerase sigma-70 factor, ECF subfamily